ncbi:MAG: hypothetical protein IPJ13_09305 [Saprospiraceae bacterium]|nr:hypothetical protein [Saprospiraceae bacterium]
MQEFDCQLVSNIINQIGIIDEPICENFIVIVMDTLEVFKVNYQLHLNEKAKKHWKIKFDSCKKIYITNNKKIKFKPYWFKPTSGNSNPNEPIYEFEPDQCFELYINGIYEFEKFFVIPIFITNRENTYYGNLKFCLTKIIKLGM